MCPSVSIFDDYEQLSTHVARMFARHLLKTPDTTLGLATGETPKRFYQKLVEFHEQDLLDFEQVTAFNLDEFYPIDPDHPKRFARYMDQHLYDHINIDRQNIFIPDGTTDQPEREAKGYEEAIREHGGIDLQLLGIGENGHIGFNEPGSDWSSETRVVSIASGTKDRYSDSTKDVPEQAITMGIKTIMHADRVVLMASGERKADVVARAIDGPVITDVPASVLQLHPNLRVCLDRAAAEQLKDTY